MTCHPDPYKSALHHMPSIAGNITGPSQEDLAQAFLVAPIPSLPHHQCIFHQDDMDETSAKASFTQFMERYHSTMSTIDVGFGPKATLSALAWIKSIADLTSCALNGICSSRANLPNPPSPQEAKLLFKPEDQDTIFQIQSNLDHLSKVFALSPDSPSLLCNHCLHRTDQNLAQDQLSEMDYTAILMATNHSWMAILDWIFSHFTRDIHREASIWALDKGTCQ
jgi:hypothetical protein